MPLQLAFYVALLWLMPIHAAIAAPAPRLDRAGLTQTFADEFQHFSWHKVDADGAPGGGTWATYLGYRWAAPDAIQNRSQPANKEEALYVDPAFRGTGQKPLRLNPFTVNNDVLSITASRAPTTPALSGYRYVTGMITTQFAFSQTYGLFEMRAKLPKGKGLWPAFWLLPVNKSWPPEIDVLEMLGHAPTEFYTTLHSKASGKHSKSDIPVHRGPDLSADFHTYAVEWGEHEIIFYFDDVEMARRLTPADMHQPFYMIANLAVGGAWPGSPTAATVFPAHYEIDWIRAWQRHKL